MEWALKTALVKASLVKNLSRKKKFLRYVIECIHFN